MGNGIDKHLIDPSNHVVMIRSDQEVDNITDRTKL